MSRQTAKYDIKANDKTGAAIKSAKRGLAGLSSAALSMSGIMGGVSAAAFAAAAKNAIDYGSSITDAATATRTGVEEYQVLKYAAQDAGAQMSNITTALSKIQKAANDANNGLATYSRAFDTLGISSEKFQKLKPERQLERIGKAMTQAKDPAKAYASVLDIIGSRNAPRLMEVLQRLGSDGFDTVAIAAREAGQVISEFDAQQLDRAADSLERFKTRATVGAGKAVSWMMDFSDVLKGAHWTASEESISRGTEAYLRFAKASGSNPKLIKHLEDIIAKANESKTALDGLADVTVQKAPISPELISIMDKAAAATDKLSLAQMDHAEKIDFYSDKVARLKREHEELGRSNALSPQTTDEELIAWYEKYIELATARQNLLTLEKNAPKELTEGYNSWADTVMSKQDMVVHAMKNASDSMTDSFMEFCESGKFAFSDFVDNMLSDIARMTFQQSVANPLTQALTGGISGMFGFGSSAAKTGGVDVAKMSYAGACAIGGSVVGGSSYLVGENGPELFTPGATGHITPDVGGSAEPVNVNFTIQANDARGFDQLLSKRSGMIEGMINSALNKRGRRGISS